MSRSSRDSIYIEVNPSILKEDTRYNTDSLVAASSKEADSSLVIASEFKIEKIEDKGMI